MPLEGATFLAGLNPAWPVGGPSGDPVSEGDDHFRQLKAVLQATFPGYSGIHKMSDHSDYGSMSIQNANAVSISGGSVTGITDLAVADGGTGASTQAGARTGLGLGSIATQAASAVAITGGSITGITDLALADGGTGASTAAGARTNFGLGSMSLENVGSVGITGGTLTGITTLEVYSASTGAFGPTLDGWHDSASPAAGDTILRIRADGENSVGGRHTYSQINFVSATVTNAAEDGKVEFATAKAGGNPAVRAWVGDGFVVGNPGGAGDMGFGSLNAHNIFDDGTNLNPCFAIQDAIEGSYVEEEWRRFAPFNALARHAELRTRRDMSKADDYVAELESHMGVPGLRNRAQTSALTRRLSLSEREEEMKMAFDYVSLAVRDLTKRVQTIEAV